MERRLARGISGVDVDPELHGDLDRLERIALRHRAVAADTDGGRGHQRGHLLVIRQHRIGAGGSEQPHDLGVARARRHEERRRPGQHASTRAPGPVLGRVALGPRVRVRSAIEEQLHQFPFRRSSQPFERAPLVVVRPYSGIGDEISTAPVAGSPVQRGESGPFIGIGALCQQEPGK